MTIDLPLVLRSEWLKRRRSFAGWLVVGGALFTPAIIIAVRLVQHAKLPALYANPAFWPSLWRSAWESMAMLLLPVAAVLATSLVTQIEYRNNAWKQVRTLPLHPAAIYVAKLVVVLVLIVQLLALFSVGIWLAAAVPWLAAKNTPWPAGMLDPWFVFAQNARYFVDCLPIVAAQYALALSSRNYLVPLGAGFVAWIAALGLLPWKYAYVFPYTYTMLDYLAREPVAKVFVPDGGVQPFALAWFVVFAVAGYVLFVARPYKG
ncbi:MAG TPA: ABC transporter permease [Tahibacter sp.]|nr:ABC transporter permease [Tahibacter sp.]